MLNTFIVSQLIMYMCLVTFKGFKTLFEGFDPRILMTCSHGLWGIYCDSKVIYH